MLKVTMIIASLILVSTKGYGAASEFECPRMITLVVSPVEGEGWSGQVGSSDHRYGYLGAYATGAALINASVSSDGLMVCAYQSREGTRSDLAQRPPTGYKCNVLKNIGTEDQLARKFECREP